MRIWLFRKALFTPILGQCLEREIGEMDDFAALSLWQCNNPGLACNESNKVCSVVFRRPFVKPYGIGPLSGLSCLSCLSATLVHCGQTVGRIKMKLGTQVGLGPGHIVLGGDQLPLPQRDTAPNFRPTSVAAKWLDG